MCVCVCMLDFLDQSVRCERKTTQTIVVQCHMMRYSINKTFYESIVRCASDTVDANVYVCVTFKRTVTNCF